MSFPFIWNAHNGIQNLIDVFTNEYDFAAKITQWAPSEVYGLSNDGKTLIGTASNVVGATPDPLRRDRHALCFIH